MEERINGFLPCAPDIDCPNYHKPGGCGEDLHHEFYPANDYTTATERAFRNLPENTTVVCRRLHDIIHRTETPPHKPSLEVMKKAIDYAEQLGQICLSATKRRKIYGRNR